MTTEHKPLFVLDYLASQQLLESKGREEECVDEVLKTRVG